MLGRALSPLLLPLHIAALATDAKSFRDNPIIGNPELNRRGLHVSRIRLAQVTAQWRRERLSTLLSPDDRLAFHRDGYLLKSDFLPAAVFSVLKEEVLSCAAPAREMLQGDTITRRIALDRRALQQLPTVRAMLQSPQWLALIRYVGSSALEPLTYIQTILAGARETAPDPQTDLHADTFHSTVKAWLFLTDVAADEGPLIYIPGSHRPTPRRLAWERRVSITAHAADFLTSRGSLRITEQVARRLRLEAPRIFAVPANTLVVADTMGIHARGQSVRPSTRIEIWAYGRRNPFLPWTGWDPLSLPFLRGNAVPLSWWIRDQIERCGGARNPWHVAGVVTPDTPAGL